MTNLEILQEVIDIAIIEFDEERMDNGGDELFTGMRNFEDAGVLTNDKGLILTGANGKKYTITIKEQ